MWYSAEWSVSMNGNRIPDYDIADIVPEYTGFTQDVKMQQQKQDSREKAKGGCSVSLISPSLSFETAAKSAFTSPLRKFPVNYNCKNPVAIQAYDADFNDNDSTRRKVA